MWVYTQNISSWLWTTYTIRFKPTTCPKKSYFTTFCLHHMSTWYHRMPFENLIWSSVNADGPRATITLLRRLHCFHDHHHSILHCYKGASIPPNSPTYMFRDVKRRRGLRPLYLAQATKEQAEHRINTYHGSPLSTNSATQHSPFGHTLSPICPP